MAMNLNLLAALFRPPNFLVRLRALIIVQCLFVFSALALILFFPLQDTAVDPDLTGTRQAIDLSARVLLDEWEQRGGATNSQYTVPLVRLPADQNVLTVSLFMKGGDSLFECASGMTNSPKEIDAHELPPDLSSVVDQQLLRACLSEKPGYLLQTAYNRTTTLCYYRLAVGGDSEPAALAALFSRDQGMSRRSEVMYAVFVLFLASLLLSLLTVNLVRRRFQQPLARLIHGLDKTADGELYSIVEPNGDKELTSLTDSFNRMSSRLWEGREKLERSNAQLAQVNESLRDTERFLATLIDNSPESIIVTSPDGHVVLFNREASLTFGYSRDQIIGQPLSKLFSVTPNAQDAHEHEAAGEDGEFEAIGVHCDLTSLPIFVVVRTVRRNDGKVWGNLYLVRDISESKSFQDMMIRLDRYYTRGEMAGDIAHEINNYLAVLAGNLELLPIILRKGDPEKLKLKLELMRGTVDKIAKFMDGLMDSSHEVAKFDPNDLNQVVQNVIAFLKPQNKFDTVTINTRLSTDLPLVEHDAGQIQQLLVNLVNNAAEALIETDGERVIEIATTLAIKDQSDFARIVVSDTGPGVLKNKEALLFEKRFTTKPRGHGIGLVTCRRITDAHHGVIRYAYRDGAVFTVELPVRQPAIAGDHSHVAETPALSGV